MSDAQLLAPSIWQKHVFTGQWVAGTGDVLAVKAPASDATLGHIGSAASEQVDAVAEKSNQEKYQESRQESDHQGQTKGGNQVHKKSNGQKDGSKKGYQKGSEEDNQKGN